MKWENSNNEDVLAEAKAEIMKSTDGNPPALLDPFAGGGSIPLEAQRLGLEAQGSIDVPVIRDQVASILEGGRDAFIQRKEKYEF